MCLWYYLVEMSDSFTWLKPRIIDYGFPIKTNKKVNWNTFGKLRTHVLPLKIFVKCYDNNKDFNDQNGHYKTQFLKSRNPHGQTFFVDLIHLKKDPLYRIP